MPPPPVPRRGTHAVDAVARGPSTDDDSERSHFLASLSEHPSLYELSQTELETLVSQVIREEGFLHLVHKRVMTFSRNSFFSRVA